MSLTKGLLVAAMVVFTVLLTGLYLGPPRICTRAAAESATARPDLRCARFADLADLCMALVFAGNTTSAVLGAGYGGELFRCGSLACVAGGDPCSCQQPFVRGATHFCQRRNQTFPCF
jgi:hypothetical protein